MNFGFSFFIGYRYWRARKANAFASFITFFAVSGIFLGVAALIVVSSVMNGLEGQLKNRILGAVPQLTLINEQGFSDWQALSQRVLNTSGLAHSVRGIVPSTTTQAMIQSRKNISAVQVYGVYPELEQALSSIASHTYSNAFEQLTAGDYHIVLGSELARKLDVNTGDKIRLLSGDGVVYSPMGPVPSQRKFTVAGVFEMGSQVDGSVAYVHYHDARKLMRKNSQTINELRVYLHDPFSAPQIAPVMLTGFAQQGVEIKTSDWRQQYGHLFSAVNMEKNMMSLMLSLIVAVAAFNMVSALVMMVIDKTSDVAVLKTQGVTTSSVMAIFIVQGLLNALLGLMLGTIVGIGLTLNLNSILSGLGISILGAGQTLPVALSLSQLSFIIVGSLLITLLATLYPALSAARVQPATALRYE
ncbi:MULTISPECIES: lipoprotein-releasing ABC transporter permease subunit [Shewanella]|jgi:lipoprotein-releasing system permease protein|uniref:lipoprotein-releasing ABC transporter permease subunit n=1 Tax=Shewanella TaxID=22 RepID=UPI00200C3693|nr:lipoprotein-releasing ABC transporter permease subunit [Shewanella basaltis]MCL1113166.1 lipoprotein-releasing ABC transporter permease subunit [Shewanella basaltis]